MRPITGPGTGRPAARDDHLAGELGEQQEGERLDHDAAFARRASRSSSPRKRERSALVKPAL